MKTKNIIILGGIAFAIYYLTKKKSSTITATSTPDIADKDLTDVSNGDEPQSLSADDKLKLFNQANLFYEGGARPTEKILGDLKIRREKALAKINSLGIYTEFQKWKATVDKKRKGETPFPTIDRPIDRRLRKPRGFGFRRDKMPLPRNRTYSVNTTSSLGLTNEPPMAI